MTQDGPVRAKPATFSGTLRKETPSPTGIAELLPWGDSLPERSQCIRKQSERQRRDPSPDDVIQAPGSSLS